MPKLPAPPRNYAIGYGKPPKAGRFTKGRSGNPKGRPRGSRNKPALTFGDERLKALLLDEAYRVIPIQDASGVLNMPMAQAIIRSVAVAAAKGQVRAQQLFLKLVHAIEDEQAQMKLDYNRTLISYKYDWEKVIEDAKKNGRPIPDPLPHPRDIQVNPRTGKVTINGPMTEHEREHWDLLRKTKKQLLEEIQTIKVEIQDPACDYKKLLEEDLNFYEKQLSIISTIIKD